MPWCDTYAMTQHLAEIARHVDQAHAIFIMDQAGWHMSNNLVVPGNRDDVIRCSVGLEDAEDLIEDILQALDFE